MDTINTSEIRRARRGLIQLNNAEPHEALAHAIQVLLLAELLLADDDLLTEDDLEPIERSPTAENQFISLADYLAPHA